MKNTEFKTEIIEKNKEIRQLRASKERESGKFLDGFCKKVANVEIGESTVTYQSRASEASERATNFG